MTPKPDHILLAHGGGGRLTAALIADEIVPRFGAGPLAALPDAARLPGMAEGIVFTTDSYVVQPAVFPGGDIGALAVHGTVNDLAVSGATPRWISLAMILEEGLPLATLRRVLDSVKAAADACGVAVATGDTKVVPHGQCDGLYINTAGLGEPIPGYRLSTGDIRPGDVVLSSGTLGDHGMAVLCARERLHVENGPVSDTGPVHRLVQAAVSHAAGIRFMRDPTRGGAAAVLNEIAGGKPWGIALREDSLPFAPAARSIAETLGIDLLHVPSEGRMLAVCAPGDAAAILAAWRALPEGAGAVPIGTVIPKPAGAVVLETLIGGRRLVDMPLGELLPRIC